MFGTLTSSPAPCNEPHSHYSSYMLAFGHQDDTDYKNEIQNDRCWHQATERTGHMYKSVGLFNAIGPFDRGDMRYVESFIREL